MEENWLPKILRIIYGVSNMLVRRSVYCTSTMTSWTNEQKKAFTKTANVVQ